jgi:hypothetical protein
MNFGRKVAFACAGMLLMAMSTLRHADAAVIPYPTPGTANPVVINTYTAGVTGFVNAVIALGTGAGLDNELGYSINGGATTFTGLLNHAPVGTNVSFSVNGGDILRFFIRTSAGDTWSSDVSLNPDGVNHFYSVAYTGTPNLGPLVPLGRYISFEDLPGGGDFNYNDMNLVITNISAGVPEPATWAMMVIGFVGLGFMSARRRRTATVAA